MLTSLDLWVALDKCAIYYYELLRDYDHGFSPSLFDPLLLSKICQMVQLDHIEQYLRQRKMKSKPGFSTCFKMLAQIVLPYGIMINFQDIRNYDSR